MHYSTAQSTYASPMKRYPLRSNFNKEDDIFEFKYDIDRSSKNIKYCKRKL